MTIVGELTAGTAEKKKTEEACRTCGATDQKLSPGGHCWDPHSCAQRRIARVSRTAHLHGRCYVRLRRHNATYFLREFGPKILPPPNPLPKGFTLKDYEANPNHVYYEAVMDRGSATTFPVGKALALAKSFDGVAINS